VVDLDLFVAGRVEVTVDLPARTDSLETETFALLDHRAMCWPDIPASAMRRLRNPACRQRGGDDPAGSRKRSGDLDPHFYVGDIVLVEHHVAPGTDLGPSRPDG